MYLCCSAVCESKIRKGINVDTVLSIMQVAYSSTLDDKPDLITEIKTNCSSFFVNHIKVRDIPHQLLIQLTSVFRTLIWNLLAQCLPN